MYVISVIKVIILIKAHFKQRKLCFTRCCTIVQWLEQPPHSERVPVSGVARAGSFQGAPRDPVWCVDGRIDRQYRERQLENQNKPRDPHAGLKDTD